MHNISLHLLNLRVSFKNILTNVKKNNNISRGMKAKPSSTLSMATLRVRYVVQTFYFQNRLKMLRLKNGSLFIPHNYHFQFPCTTQTEFVEFVEWTLNHCIEVIKTCLIVQKMNNHLFKLESLCYIRFWYYLQIPWTKSDKAEQCQNESGNNQNIPETSKIRIKGIKSGQKGSNRIVCCYKSKFNSDSN